MTKRVPQLLLVAFGIVALAGFIDSSYLTAEHLRGVVPPCTLVSGCDLVLTSSFAVAAGVPTSSLGMLYYGTLLVLLIAYLDSRIWRVLHIACWMTVAGLLASAYFVYVQAFVLSAYCLYCLISAGLSAVLFILGVRIMRID